MKKSLLAVMAILLLCFTPAKAQTDDSNERAQQQIDSLNQIVAQLSEKVEDQEEEMEMADVWSRRKFFNIGFSRLKLDPPRNCQPQLEKRLQHLPDLWKNHLFP